MQLWMKNLLFLNYKYNLLMDENVPLVVESTQKFGARKISESTKKSNHMQICTHTGKTVQHLFDPNCRVQKHSFSEFILRN
jgi:hypothetical protein